MKRSQEIKVNLNVNREEDRKILDYLPYAGMPMSKVFKVAMLQYIDWHNGDYRNDPYVQAVRQVVREELKDAQFQSSGSQVQSFSQASNDDEEVDPLAFLEELEKMADN